MYLLIRNWLFHTFPLWVLLSQTSYLLWVSKLYSDILSTLTKLNGWISAPTMSYGHAYHFSINWLCFPCLKTSETLLCFDFVRRVWDLLFGQIIISIIFNLNLAIDQSIFSDVIGTVYLCKYLSYSKKSAQYLNNLFLLSVDPFSKKEWYDVKAPSMFAVRQVGKTLVTRSQGTSKLHCNNQWMNYYFTWNPIFKSASNSLDYWSCALCCMAI